MPVATLTRVCAVVPHVPDDARRVAADPTDFSDVERWWISPFTRDFAGAARGADWLDGVPAEARSRPAPVLEEMCELCHGTGSASGNKMYLCDWPDRCLWGWHKACLLSQGVRPPRKGDGFYCEAHRKIIAASGSERMHVD